MKVHLHHFSNIKIPKEVTKQKESRFSLLFLLDHRRIRIREAQKHVDPVDLDSENWKKLRNSKFFGFLMKDPDPEPNTGLYKVLSIRDARKTKGPTDPDPEH